MKTKQEIEDQLFELQDDDAMTEEVYSVADDPDMALTQHSWRGMVEALRWVLGEVEYL